MNKSVFPYLGFIALHIFIGILIYLNKSVAKVYFWTALAVFLFRIIVAHKDKKTIEVLLACAYFVGAELILRMTRGAVAYEASKYLLIIFMMMGILYKGMSGKAYPYFLYILLLIPSIFVASTTLSFDAKFRTNITFVLSGPICLGIASLFCYGKKISREELSKILLYVLLPIITLTTYIYFYNPDIKEVLDNTLSNVDASGGFGPNQVATALGLGAFILTVRFFINSPTMAIKIVNLILMMLVSYRAVVTFSRGGVIAALVTIFAFLIVYFAGVSKKKKNEIILTGTIFIFSLCVTWFISSQQTDGYIDLRYANKDHLGREKSDVTTGRGKLFMEELEGFIENPFLGIGSSRAKDQRIEEVGQGITSHSEVSRTLAEHGMLGVIILLIILIKPMDFRAKNKHNYFFYAFLCFWFATINHSSMRIAAPAFIYSLALLNVKFEKPSIHRKQLKA